MDITGANDQTNGIMTFANNWDQTARASNLRATEKYKSTIDSAQAQQTVLKGYDEGAGTVAGVSSLLTGAKVYGNAKNFDSEIAGFGQGKGASGYLRSQGQIVRGRMRQGKQTIQTAVGMRDADDIAQSGADLGLKQTKSYPGWQAGMGEDGTITAGADASKVVDDSDAGRAVAKASGGLLSAEKSSAEGGVVGGAIKKIGKFVSDMPEGQLGAVADIGGKAIGVGSAIKGIYDDWGGGWSKDTTSQKVANVGDIVAGGLDAVSMAMPMLAPVGAVASAVSSVMDIGAQADSEKAKEKTASDANVQTAVKGAPSLSSAGLVAKQQLSAY